MTARPRHHNRRDLERIADQAMRDRGLLPAFEPAVHDEVDRLDRAAEDDTARDLRSLLWCSIDNDDSRDLDQLSVAEPLDAGRTRVLVAIADVDALVAKGSAIDRHAHQNTTSIYTAAKTYPMLPERLSWDLTSLVQDEDRLAVVVEAIVDGAGSIVGADVYRATVRNRAKLAYNAVGDWLEGRGEAPPALAAVPGLEDNLRLQDEVAQRLRALRHEHGALDLETIEPRAVFTDGELADLETEKRNRAKDLIEDLMVAANGVTARFLDRHRFPSLRRVLRSPERWARIVEVAAEHGGSLPPSPDAVALEAFLRDQHQRDPLRFPDLSLTLVKLMGSGEYAVEMPGQAAPGHFGLAVRDYTHSTAPNRRYPDLVTQRLLKAALAASAVPYDGGEMQALALHCTEQEDDANKVERQVRKSAGALLLEDRIGEVFDGIVTGASEKGTWVRIFHPPVEGKVERGWEGLDVGHRTRVKLISVDVERGFIDFARTGAPIGHPANPNAGH
ncbi:MAG: RNB domain-containing ribonuclease [Acidobacteriota bacterium]